MKNLYKINYQDDKFVLFVNNESCCTGTRQECIDKAYSLGASSKAIRYGEEARILTAANRYRLVSAKRVSGKALTKLEENFLVRYKKYFADGA